MRNGVHRVAWKFLVRQPFAREVHPRSGKQTLMNHLLRKLYSRTMIAVVLMVLGTGTLQMLQAGDIKITLPKRSKLTPVQRLNREGVEAVNKHQFDKAKSLFYEAYLYDPGDPFTLNNLGYLAELEGQVDRAENFYALATKQATDALIDRASVSKLQGESLQNAINAVRDIPMQVNRGNVNAVHLLSEGRVREADAVLQKTLALDPKNAFTLNNIGVVKEAEGEYNEAIRYYEAAAAQHVEDPVIVTVSSAWRGKPLTEMANKSAARLRSRMKTLQSDDAQAKLLNLQGVSALNRNEWQAAREDFAKAYKLDPYNAFALNNQGYISEMNGDLETAQEFYREAQKASGATSRVGIATRPAAEGDRLVSVARGSTDAVDQSIEALAATRRRNAKPIQLKRRDGTTVINEPSAESSPVAPSSQPEANPPVPDVQQDQPEPPQEPQSSSPPQ